MNRTILIVIGILAALVTAAGIISYQPPIHEWKGINGSVPNQYYSEEEMCGDIADLKNFKLPLYHEKNEESYKDYTASVYRTYENYGYLEIHKNGRLIYARKGYAFYLNNFPGNYGKNPESGPIMGTDITGDGQPNLVIGEWTGGMHASFNSYVFAIGAEFRKIAMIEGGCNQPIFKDIDNDKHFEAIMNDWTWAYWPSSFASSPAPEIILRYEQGKYILALELMRRPPKTKEEFAQVKRQVKEKLETDMKEQSGDFSLALVVNPMFDMIYSGNAKQAWQLFDEVWTEQEPNRQETVKFIQEALTSSPYWPEIDEMKPREK